MKRLLMLPLLFCLFTPHQAQAELFVEPLVGYNFGAKFDFDDDTYSGTGTSYGGRLGFTQLGFQLGLDYLSSSIKVDDDDFDDNVDMSEWGGFIGYQFPIFLRIYAGYIFSATGESKDKTLGKYEFSKGSGSKLGVGFTGLPFVAINVEYRMGQFDELELGGVETDEKVKYKSLLLSLSVPLSI